MKRPVKLGVASLKALATFVALGAAAHASLPYLPLIGPSPLRLQAAPKPEAASAKFEMAPVVPQPQTNEATAVSNAASTNDLLNVATSTQADQGPITISEAPEPFLGDPFTASVFAIPTPDLLGITPQMLSTYFHPVFAGTNAAALVAPYRVSFMPPLPPDKSSHAQYIIK